METGYRKLIVWKKADELVHEIYVETKNFPKDELYGGTSQIRRAALSIPTNIAEGMGRRNKNELKQFLNIALGSLSEVEYLLEFCLRLNYFDRSCYDNLEGKRQEVGRLLWSFHRSFIR